MSRSKNKLLIIMMCVGVMLFTACGSETLSTEVDKTLIQTDSTDTENASNELNKGAVTEVDEKQTEYTFTDMDLIKYAKSSVNLRDLPSTDGNKIGGLNENDEVKITGQCNETDWFRIEYQGLVAYVSSKYLMDQSVEIQETSTESATDVPIAESVVSTVESPVEATDNESNNTNSSSVIVPTEAETVGELVWVPTNGGTKYHSKSGCSNMIDPIQVSLETAIANGFDACKRCH